MDTRNRLLWGWGYKMPKAKYLSVWPMTTDEILAQCMSVSMRIQNYLCPQCQKVFALDDLENERVNDIGKFDEDFTKIKKCEDCTP